MTLEEAKALGFSPTSIAELMREIVKDVRRKEAEARLRPRVLRRMQRLLKKIAKAASRGKTDILVHLSAAEAKELQFMGFSAYPGTGRITWD